LLKIGAVVLSIMRMDFSRLLLRISFDLLLKILMQ